MIFVDHADGVWSDNMNEKEMKELAEQHYTYVESVCHKMYVDAFVHGIKHGQEDKVTNIKTSDYEKCKACISDC